MLASINKLVRSKTDKWLFQLRDAEAGEVFLHQRRVFILPAGAGIGFAVLLLVLLIGATNYTLGLGFALTFIAACSAIVDMYLTYKNLGQLHLQPGRVQPVFAGEDAQFELVLVNRTSLDRYSLHVDFIEKGRAARYVSDVGANGRSTLMLSAPTAVRGWLAAPRIRLSTRFPLGLFEAWSYWQPDLKALVYPYPEDVAPPLPMAAAGGDEGGGHAGTDNFAGIRSYQAGDQLRHLAWRQIARLDPSHGGQLVTKHFEGGARAELVLDFAALPANMDLELRLSRMTRWVLEAEQRGLPYAFHLGRHQFAPSAGAAHQAACLRALALHALPGAAP